MKEKAISILVMLVLLFIGSVILYPTPKSSVGAQSAPAPDAMAGMDHPANNAVDGSVNPELIKDKDAYRLFFVAASSNLGGVDNSADTFYLRGIFVGLTDDQLTQIRTILLNFKGQYAQLVSDYNATITNGTQQGDLDSFRNTRDSLVAQTRQQAETILGPSNSNIFLGYIHNEKKNMVVGIEDSGPN